MRKPARLKALTGLRCFAAINIVFFHFSNPQWFGWLAPVVNAGYASVSYFILLSGFVLGYNYNARARAGELDTVRFYKARFTRLYPIYLLSLLLAWRVVPLEYGAPHPRHVLDRAWCSRRCCCRAGFRRIATFLNTPAWTMSAESFYYVLFPWMARWKTPSAAGAASLETGRRLDAGPDSRHALHRLQSRRHRPSRPLELRPVAAGAQIHAAAAPGQLRLRRSAGRTGRDSCRARAVCASSSASSALRPSSCCSRSAAIGALRHPSRRPADAAVRLHHSGTGRGESAGHARSACARWSLSARPAIASTCSTSTCGT